ncbi:MAG: DUF4188 domain-containing protein [Gammaproteobacteria bacterium]
MTIISKRMTVELEETKVVFLIGLRINKLWKIHQWLHLVLTMPKLLKELRRQDVPGFISGNMWYGRNILMVQYWDNFKSLEQYAKNNSRSHMPVWTYFNMRILSSAAVGVWHETYQIEPGQFEAIYTNMPRYGLATAGDFIEIDNSGIDSNATKRMSTK